MENWIQGTVAITATVLTVFQFLRQKAAEKRKDEALERERETKAQLERERIAFNDREREVKQQIEREKVELQERLANQTTLDALLKDVFDRLKIMEKRVDEKTLEMVGLMKVLGEKVDEIERLRNEKVQEVEKIRQEKHEIANRAHVTELKYEQKLGELQHCYDEKLGEMQVQHEREIMELRIEYATQLAVVKERMSALQLELDTYKKTNSAPITGR
jgi:hypothetical protein